LLTDRYQMSARSPQIDVINQSITVKPRRERNVLSGNWWIICRVVTWWRRSVRIGTCQSRRCRPITAQWAWPNMLMSHSWSLIGRFSGYLWLITWILMRWPKSGSYILLLLASKFDRLIDPHLTCTLADNRLINQLLIVLQRRNWIG